MSDWQRVSDSEITWAGYRIVKTAGERGTNGYYAYRPNGTLLLTGGGMDAQSIKAYCEEDAKRWG